jgi:hypothetical protein
MANMVDRKRQRNFADPFATPSRETLAASRMAYMADLLLEMKDMAATEGHATLAGLLALAHMEALEKAR